MSPPQAFAKPSTRGRSEGFAGMGGRGHGTSRRAAGERRSPPAARREVPFDPAPGLSKIQGPPSENQRALEVQRRIAADVLDPTPGVLVERVDAEAVRGWVDDLQETVPQQDPLGGADEALEDGL